MITEDDFPAIGNFRPNEAQEGAVALIEDARGRLLMQLRDDLEGIHWPGRWGLVGGGVEAGEDLETAALREIWEETGMRLAPGMLTPFAKVNSVSRAGAKVFVFGVRLEISPVDIRLGEGAGFAFLTPAQARGIGILDTLIPVLDLYLERGLAGPVRRLP